MTAPFTFRPHEHLRRPADYQRVYDRRRSASDDWMIVYVCENDLPYTRLGRSVSRKYGGAVQRNRLRRLYREAFRLTRHELPTGIDLILIRAAPDEPTLDVLKEVLPRLVRRAVKRLSQEKERT